MSDETRTARLTALLAGNAYILIKLIDWALSHKWGTAALFPLLPFTGLGAAYVSMLLPAKSRGAVYTEAFSVANIVGAIIGFAIFGATHPVWVLGSP
jgi:hypothetical protein